MLTTKEWTLLNKFELSPGRVSIRSEYSWNTEAVLRWRLNENIHIVFKFCNELFSLTTDSKQDWDMDLEDLYNISYLNSPVISHFIILSG
ncbi:unnamed protein product [Rotaria socialis]